jgi:uncharacterized protein with FMN-binding domain
MKKDFRFVISAVAIAAVTIFVSAMPGDEIMSKSKDTTIVNTELIAKDVKGYKGATPVKIYIRKNKVVKIEALPNRETPKFFARAKSLLSSWDGKTVSKAAKMDVDGVSGATFSSKALIKNVQMGLKYYKEHK